MTQRKPTAKATRFVRKTNKARRFLLSIFTAAVVGLQATSCSFTPGVGPAAARTPSSTATSFATCPQHFAGGRPPITPKAPKLRELCFDGFAVLHSGNTKTPIYVAQRLNRQMLQDGQGIKRTDRFYADARLPAAERAELEDYKGSGWSRGHMAPAGDMGTPEAKAQSFSLANMVPQDAKQNGGPWSKIEEDTRKYVMRARGDVYVITGPVFEPGAQTIGAGRVVVPSHVFKLIYDPSTGKSWAHWQENSPLATVGRPISYEEVVSRTKIELLPGFALRD
ncbi:endonuclease [Acidovorax sp. Leaf84]|uniref:DNA/RNA non-specific endonuclease n=1 Tax=Acidovorax sp. Leaf84 TaxID=1736240 RepID=UPI000701FA8D|nr:DNA/RNA non-specific endonuclease [Acidovorax sp. Leaf84]KQO38065.1 endonuclease [Acidovorax sp. Leaf84]